ncbi:hypothetical protein ACC691_39715, partial [Rhizobium johnstonii]|uniref:hypothetical protein n=1 Tax=Rhizobium johnstonii TaxID=3019933 RepID=UPI003F9D1A7C
VFFDAPTSRGITLSTSQGFQAGQDWLPISNGDGIGISGCNAVSVETVDIPVNHDGHDSVITAGVGFRLDAAETTVKWVVAPETFG